MAYAEPNAKANRCIVDQDYATALRPPAFSPSSSKWWLYQQHEVDTGSFFDSQYSYVEDNNVGILEAIISGSLQKKPMVQETWTEDDHRVDYSDQPDKLFSELESQWIRIGKNEPWWHTADLSSFVSHKSLEHVDNCDLPLPQRNQTGQLVCEKGLPCGLDIPFSTTQSDEIKNSVIDTQLSNAELLEALFHSQRRVREAESTAHKANNEKEHIITLFLKQSSQIFAYKQWLYMLQLEKLCLQLRHRKDQPICTRFPGFVPWSHTDSKQPKRVHKRYNMQKFVETMPFCHVGKNSGDHTVNNSSNGNNIFYRTYGNGPVKVLMIIGLAGTHDSWNPQIQALVGSIIPNDDDHHRTSQDDFYSDHNGIQVCAFDNRGMGRSFVPKSKSEYTTRIMAEDGISVMDHLGWKKAHVFGHSMGGMIACKLAATFPDRILSLALLNVTGGGYECFPKIDSQTLSIAMRFLWAKTPEQRAEVDLDTHYSQEYLNEYVGLKTRRQILYQEYVKGILANGMQSNCGFDGQINACWTHKVSKTDLEVIRAEGFLISVIHGRHDVIAQMSHAKRLAEKLYPLARMIELPGGHLVSHERTKEVNEALLDLIRASETKTSSYDWTNLSSENSKYLLGIQTGHGKLLILAGCWTTSWSSTSRLYSETESSNPAINNGVAEKLKLTILYIIGLFLMVFEYIKRVLRHLKPVGVNPDLS